MSFTYLFLANFGDWVESNIFSIVSLVLIAIGAIIWLIRLEGSVNQMAKKTDKIEKSVEDASVNFHAHTKDRDAHVNQLYISTLRERIERLEHTVETGHKTIGDKIDHLTARIYGARD